MYFLASPANATQRYLYRARLDGDGTARARHAGGPAGHAHLQRLAGRPLGVPHLVAVRRPPVTELVSLPDHRVVRTLRRQRGARQQARAAHRTRRPSSSGSTVGDGVDARRLHAEAAAFDAARKYPFIVYVYGEPAAQTVNDAGAAQHAVPSARSPSRLHRRQRRQPRHAGAEGRGVAQGRLRHRRRSVVEGTGGGDPRADRAAASVPRSRRASAIWGWSGGGSNTLNAMFRYPGRLQGRRGGRAGAGSAALRHDLSGALHGPPAENAEGYRVGSPIHFAEGLQGKLLIVHGSGDDNVHYQGTERLVNRLVELGKPFDLMVYPNRSHSISEGPGTTLHVYSLVARYIVEHLPAGPR